MWGKLDTRACVHTSSLGILGILRTAAGRVVSHRYQVFSEAGQRAIMWVGDIPFNRKERLLWYRLSDHDSTGFGVGGAWTGIGIGILDDLCIYSV